jgi:hypothetical protein
VVEINSVLFDLVWNNQAESYTSGVIKYKSKVYYIAMTTTIMSEHLKIKKNMLFCVCIELCPEKLTVAPLVKKFPAFYGT